MLLNMTSPRIFAVRTFCFKMKLSRPPALSTPENLFMIATNHRNKQSILNQIQIRQYIALHAL